MTSDHFRFDYDLNSLKKIKIHDFHMWITPRYLPHYKNNGYESFSTEVVNTYLKDNSTFVDVGAHYGYYSVLASRAKNNVEVISIEPVEENFKILEKNLKLNNVKKSITHNVAVSNENDIKEFNVTEASDSAGFYNHPLTKSRKKIKIQTKSLDTLLENKKIDFIKIDVEGHEISVLSGMKKVISSNKKLKMLIEFNPKILESAGFKPQDLIDKIEKLGFEVYLIDEVDRRYYRLTDNEYTWDQIIPVEKHKYFYANLFCVKKEESLFTTFFSHTSGLEGAEKSLLKTIQKLPYYGVISHLICPSHGLMTEKLKEKAVAVDIIPFTWWSSTKNQKDQININSSLLFLGQSLETLKKINPHLIYTNTSVIPWGALSAFLLKKPHVWHVREFGDKDHHLDCIISSEEADELIRKLSDEVIYNSKAVMRHHSGLLSSKKEKVIHQGIELESFQDEKMIKIYKKKNSLKLILAGSFRESKGQHRAIEAVANLVKKGLDVELLLLGKFETKDNYYKKIKSLVKKNNLKNVYFKNFVTNPHSYIKKADILLMCSESEAFGRVTIEGMLLKKVVIGFKSGGTSELIHDNVTGFLYDKSKLSLEKKIEYLIKNPKKMRIVANNGYEKAIKKYDIEKYVKKIHKVLIGLRGEDKNEFNSSKNLILEFLKKTQLYNLQNSFKMEYKKGMASGTNSENLKAVDILKNIQSSKFFKLWQKYCSVRDRALSVWRNL